jgi:multiple sugar transport system permease protein
MNKRFSVLSLLRLALLIALTTLVLLPIIRIVLDSFKTNMEIFVHAHKWLPNSLSLTNYTKGWRGFHGHSFGRFLINTVWLSVLASLGNTFMASLAGYGLGRYSFRAKSALTAMVVLQMMIPVQVLLVPRYVFLSQLGLNKGFLPILLPQIMGNGFFVYLFYQFAKTIPQDLIDSASIDGASAFSTYRMIGLPLLRPAFVLALLFSFVWNWGDFIQQLVYLTEPAHYTVSLALSLFIDPESGVAWGSVFAMSSISLIPPLVLFLVIRNLVTDNAALSGLKL